MSTCNETTRAGNETDRSGNETIRARNETTCRVCGVPLRRTGTGRPPKYCSSAHRVRFHRQHAAESPIDVPSVSTDREPNPVERQVALETLACELEDLNALRGVGQLRRIAEAAADLDHALDCIDESAWALGDSDEIVSAVEACQDYRPTLLQAMALDDLADDLAGLGRAIRTLRGLDDNLSWLQSELECSDGELLTT